MAKQSGNPVPKGRRTSRNGVEYRSRFEADQAGKLSKDGISFVYEGESIKYTEPATCRKYIPDFKIETQSGKTLYIETKGRFTSDDRKKMLLLKTQRADKDIRMVFQRATNRLSKTSKTTYGQWCDKYGIMWADGGVPKGWIDE